MWRYAVGKAFSGIYVILLLLSGGFSAMGQLLIYENFDFGIPATWTINNGGSGSDTWLATQNGILGNTFDGTQFAAVRSDLAGVNDTLHESLTSPAFDASSYSIIMCTKSMPPIPPDIWIPFCIS